jgi:hypothetical protein
VVQIHSLAIFAQKLTFTRRVLPPPEVQRGAESCPSRALLSFGVSAFYGFGLCLGARILGASTNQSSC